MKSLAELAAIREKMKDKVILREGTGDIRVVVGMATCASPPEQDPFSTPSSRRSARPVSARRSPFLRRAASAFASMSR